MLAKEELINHFQEVGDEITVLYLEGKYKENKERFTTQQWLHSTLKIQNYVKGN